MSLRIGIVAGEASGDLLAADLMQAIRARVPDVQFEGVAGPLMQAAGCQVLYPAEKLAVMGLVEVLGHLPELLRIRRALRRHFLANPPDLFIGVDAPDFNLALERRLKGAGIPTVHYVSPSVWAWRQYRVRKIARSIDLMLTLFPFEADFYRAHQVPVRFVGHPLADQIPDRCQRRAVRLALKLPERGRILALLPGSRRSEVSRLAEPFLRTALWLRRHLPDLQFIAPLAPPATREHFEAVRRPVAPRGHVCRRCRAAGLRHRRPGVYAAQAPHGGGLSPGAPHLLAGATPADRGPVFPAQPPGGTRPGAGGHPG